MKYGILIGRFQPLHLAHQAIINEIMHDGLRPLVFIGSSNKDDDKNPFSYLERAAMFHEIYGSEVTTFPLPDNTSDTIWSKQIVNTLIDINIKPKECKIYYFKKSYDKHDIFTLLPGFSYEKPKYPEVFGEISSSDIRQNPWGNKQYLDGRVLRIMAEHGFLGEKE